jgi:hypothetical protein
MTSQAILRILGTGDNRVIEDEQSTWNTHVTKPLLVGTDHVLGTDTGHEEQTNESHPEDGRGESDAKDAARTRKDLINFHIKPT